MVQKKNNYHPNFNDYIDFIINQPHYDKLPYKTKKDGSPVWVAAKKSKDNIGNLRVAWADEKAIELGFENSSKKYADTMLAIHPTKEKACQWCGETMSLYYVYPTKNTIKHLVKNFNYQPNIYHSIYDIVEILVDHEEDIKLYLIDKAELDAYYQQKSTLEVIHAVEYACRMEGKSIFSPGAMSNFPDRFDGFHSYNLCCRKNKDTGRHDANMATYTQDRRAYEYWSDGNIVAANQLMGDKTIFKGLSADHIGPISLGFIHDPINLQPMTSSDNSAKRDRLYEDDINKLIQIENQTGISPASGFAKDVWTYIKKDFQQESASHSLDDYRHLLKQNMVNFMESLWILRDTPQAEKIDAFLVAMIFQPKYDAYFSYRYTFNEQGNIAEKLERNVTATAKNEFERYVTISITSIDTFHSKGIANRHYQASLSAEALERLNQLKKSLIEQQKQPAELYQDWLNYLQLMQSELIHQ